jgi:hypothetical protein
MPIFRHVTKYRHGVSPEHAAQSLQVFWDAKLGLLVLCVSSAFTIPGRVGALVAPGLPSTFARGGERSRTVARHAALPTMSGQVPGGATSVKLFEPAFGQAARILTTYLTE